MERITVAQLAKELGVSLNKIMQLAAKVGIRVTRGAATLSPAQADRVRARANDETQRAARAALRPQSPGAPKAIDRVRLAVPAPDDEPRVGPPNPCGCCGLNIGGRRPDDDEDLPLLCPQCAAHYAIEGEDESRVQTRLRDHDVRLRLVYARLWSQMTDTSERLRAALRSRNAWRRVLVEVALLHEENLTGCSCGAKNYPCATVRAIETTNRGIARQVEGFLAMDDDVRDTELGDETPWFAA